MANCHTVEDLGFGQLNDLLLVKFFPNIANQFFESEQQDERKLSELSALALMPGFSSFDVNAFYWEIKRRIKGLSPILDTEPTPEIILQDLCWIAFAVERWGQSISHYEPGFTANAIQVNSSSETLHDFLSKRLGKYNTLERFALRSTGAICGIRGFKIQAGRVKLQSPRIDKSSYAGFSRYFDHRRARFPSTLDMSPFLRMIKKGELVAQVYNDLIIELITTIKKKGLDAHEAINSARSIAMGFNMARRAMVDFLRDKRFSTRKFIFIIRQFTVDLQTSPADKILRLMQLDAAEFILAKGFLNHHLQLASPEPRFRGIVAWESLRNEGISLPSLNVWLKQFLSAAPSDRYGMCVGLLERKSARSDRDEVQNVMAEVLGLESGAKARIRYVLKLLQCMLPKRKDEISAVLNDRRLLEELEQQFENSPYTPPASGANSLAFFGGDILLGIAADTPNYYTHVLGRLAVMMANDQDRFWKFLSNDFIGLPAMLRDVVRVGSGPEGHRSDSPALAFVAMVSTKEARKLRIYRPYFELIAAFGALSDVHSGCINRFLRQVSKGMHLETKHQLLNTPDHGTTFMQQTHASIAADRKFRLPSLVDLCEARRMNEVFARKILAEIGTTKVMTPRYNLRNLP